MRIHRHEYFDPTVADPTLLPSELTTPTLTQINRLPPRATCVPAQRGGIYYRNKEESDRIFLLNGDYRFALFDDAAPEGFEAEGFDDADWDVLDVPSMWQYRGFAEPTYPNVEYPFPFDPPYILRRDPVGCYRRTFSWKADAALPQTILHFAGVDNAYYAYLNGVFVGFSKGSRLPAEFDVTALLREGENTLAVKVYTYSDATYLENQDMLMANGIFRDVYLIRMPAEALWDQDLLADTKTLSCKATLRDATAQAVARFTLDGETRECPFVNGVAEIVFEPEHPRLWTAETPELYDYTLEIVADGRVVETHSKRVGFRSSGMIPRHFCVNDTPVLLKGVNRHENDPDNGRAMTVAQIKRDLDLIKSHNINAIRTAHYPNNPAFYELCSEIGIYVMDEGDIETHGCGITGDQGFLNKCESWRPAFLDRTVRMAERDKNETCIVLWSIGNEYGCGGNTVACGDFLRAFRAKKPVNCVTDNDNSCFAGAGYPDLATMRADIERYADGDKPILEVEYAHAMGNGPGNLKHMWEIVLDHPNDFCGGFVWEFRSHGMRRVNADGSEDMLYGGDFHDDYHWSNFTIDGYLTSDSTPKPTFRELKYVYAPARFKYADGLLTVENIQDFTSLEDWKLTITVECDAAVTEEIELTLPDIEPRGIRELEIGELHAEGRECFMTVRMYRPNGEDCVALEQFALERTAEKEMLVPKHSAAVTMPEAGLIRIEGEGWRADFRKGVPVFYQVGGRKLFDAPMRFVTYRAETDNDGITGLFPRWIGAWESRMLNTMKFYCMSQKAEPAEDGAKIVAEGVLTAHAYAGFKLRLIYSMNADGLMLIDSEAHPFGDMPELNGATYGDGTPVGARLPRFGVCFALNKAYKNVRWFGRGPEQNYTDSFAAAPVGLYSLPIEDMNFMYDVPQETGSRNETRFASVSDGETAFTVYGSDRFSFQLHPWTLDALRGARHKSELKEDPAHNYLYVDYRMRALGSLSCGPNPEPEDDFEPHDFRFVFAIHAEDATEALPKHFGKAYPAQTAVLKPHYRRETLAAERNAIECDRPEDRA